MRIRRTLGDRIFDTANVILQALFCLTILYPLIYVISLSLSDSNAIGTGGIRLLPSGFTFDAYKMVLWSQTVKCGFANTLWRTLAGTSLSLLLGVCTAYPLSKKGLPHRGLFTTMIVFTMFFSGGLVPTYLVISDLGLINNRWVLVLPMLFSAYNLVIMRNSFMALPEDMEESARIDGANDIVILFRIIVPVSLPIIATVGLWVAVAHWNAWFDSMIYIRDLDKQVLQMPLRKLVIEISDAQMQQTMKQMASVNSKYSSESVKMAMIVVTMLPIMAVYPFIQRFFVKGIMVGALKG